MDLFFFFNSVLLGVGLAMDAFSVSIANGLQNPAMKKKKVLAVAGTFALFQFLMPMIGWFCVHTIVRFFRALERFIPYIALALLLFIGVRMILENVRRNKKKKNCESCGKTCSAECAYFINEESVLDGKTLLLQGIATSIDALSVGFTIADYDTYLAFFASLIIAAVTLLLCLCGVVMGKRIGSRFRNAEIFGGVILILIGLEIFLKGVF